MSTLPLTGLGKLAPPPSDSKITELAVDLPPGDSTLELQLALPEGTKLNPGAPLKLDITAEDPAALSCGSVSYDGGNVSLPLELAGARAVLGVSGPVYYCDAGNEGLCYVGRVSLRITITADNTAERIARRTFAPYAG